jgi:hypothetical protein
VPDSRTLPRVLRPLEEYDVRGGDLRTTKVNVRLVCVGPRPWAEYRSAMPAVVLQIDQMRANAPFLRGALEVGEGRALRQTTT